MRAALYVRVSTDEQLRHGYSLAAQEEECRRKAEGLGATEFAVYNDGGWSGGTLERPDLTRLRADVQAGVIALVVALDPDRLSRDLVGLLVLADEFDTPHSRLVFCTMDWQKTPEGKLFLSMKGAVGEFERAKIRERTISGRRRKVREGLIGTAPVNAYGYIYADHTLQVNDDEARVVRRIYDLCLEDKGSWQIARTLQAEGIPAPKGGTWQHGTIQRILRNPLYKGALRQFDSSVEVTPILELSVWEAVQLVVDRHLADHPGRAAAVRAPLLAGLGRCSMCGGAIYCQGGRVSDPMSGHYVCAGRRSWPHKPPSCQAPYHPRRAVDPAVWTAIMSLLHDDAAWLSALEDDGTLRQREDQRQSLQREAAELRGSRDRMLKLVVRGAISEEEAEHALRESADRLRRVQHTLGMLDADLAARSEERTRLLQSVEAIRQEAAAAASPEVRRQVARKLLREVVLSPDHTCRLILKTAQ